MNLVLIGKHVHSEVWEENQLDIPLFERLARASDNLLIISQGRVEKLTIVQKDNIELVLIPVWSRGEYLSYIFSAVRAFMARRNQVDWHVLSASEPVGGGVTAVLLHWWCKVPFVAMVQGDLLDLPPSHFSALKRWILKRITLFVATRAQAVRAVSGKISSGLVAEGVFKDKVTVLRNRVDLERFNAVALSSIRDEKRNVLYWKDNRVLVYVGSLTIEKGARDFVEACRELLPHYEDLRVLVVGDGFLRGWCEDRLAFCSDKVYFSGFIPHGQIHQWLSVGDIYVFCSHHEGMPRVILEYMAMSKPIISTAVGGIGEVIEDGVNGLLIETGDVGDLVEKTKMVLDGNFDGRVLGQNARQTVEDFHDLEATIADQISVYRKVAEVEGLSASADTAS